MYEAYYDNLGMLKNNASPKVPCVYVLFPKIYLIIKRLSPA